MPIPTIGEHKSFYCSCIETSRKESYRDKDFRTEERSVTDKGSLATAWICKARAYKTISTGMFSTKGSWMYFWECMNCGKKRDIGVWDSDGNNYGDGAHL